MKKGYVGGCQKKILVPLEPQMHKTNSPGKSNRDDKSNWVCNYVGVGSVDARTIVGELDCTIGPSHFSVKASRRAAAGRAQLLANSGRRGMGRIPRKCKLRGPCRVTCGVTYGSAYISPGLNWENPAKFRQNLAIFIFCFSDFRTKFGRNGAKNCQY